MFSVLPRDRPRDRPHGALGWARTVLLRVFAALGVFALLWTVAVGWGLPRFAQPRIESAATQALGLPFSLGRLEIAPWSLVVTATGVVLGPPDASLLKIVRVQADLSVESLWRLAPVLRRLTVTEPELRIERIAADRFNFTPVLEALARQPAAPPGAPPSRFALYNIRVIDGRIDAFDRVTQSEHRVQALQIGVPFVSNLPSQLATDVEPLLDAQIDGSRLHLQGKTLPFTQGRRSTLDIDWQQLDLAQWAQALAPLLPKPLPLNVTGGDLALALQIAFEQRPDDQAPLLRITGGATVAGLRAVLPAQGVQVGWERLALSGLDLQPFASEVSIGSVLLQAPEAQVDLPALLDGQSTPVASTGTPSPAAAKPWQWRVGDVMVNEGRVTLRHPAWPEAQTLKGMTFTAKQLDGRVDAAPAPLGLALEDGHGATLKLDATLRIAAAQVQLAAQADGWDLSAWLAPWQPLLPVRLMAGKAAFRAKADASRERWAVSDVEATLAGVDLHPAAALAAPAAVATRRGSPDRMTLQRIVLSGLEAGARTGEPVSVRARTLAVDALDLRAARQKDGTLDWLPREPAGDTAKRSATGSAAAPVDAAAPRMRWQLDELRCTGCAVSFTDEAVGAPAAIGFSRAELTLRGLGDDAGKPIGFELASQWRQGGRVQLRGSVTPQPLAVRSRVDLAALDLRMLQPYLRPYVNLELVSAKLDAAGEASLDGPQRSVSTVQPASSVASARWRGKLGLNELRTVDSLNQAELLRWRALRLDGMQLAWSVDAPLQADLGSVSLQDFYSRVILNADARLNLLDIAKSDEQGDTRSLTTPGTVPSSGASAAAAPVSPPAGAASSATTSATTPATARPQLRWREIALAGGTVDFTDNFIRPNYSAKLTDLSGTVAALAWDDPQPAAVAVAGKVDGSAPLEISGSLHPLGARLATDITASARGIDITRLTGYAARYAGYGIEKGTLSVKVRYKIAAGQLEADNNLYLDQLTFGDKVDSPDALNLPVQLAVSLLKDRNGVIDLNLPIRGSLDDPQFSIGGLIVKVVVNLITKAVTAPFTLLANALGGGGGPALSHVDFAAGSSDLTDPGRQALDTLAKALTDRPALRLEATGHADAAQDQPGLRAQYLDGLLRAAKARSTGELPDSVKVAPTERARWLEAAYENADFKAKPRNVIGLQKSLPAPEMEALLLANAPAGDTALRQLADERGNRVKAYLVTRLPPERVLLTASKLDAATQPGAAAGPRVDFALK